MMMVEEWRPIPSADGRYEASSLGRVRNSRTGAVLNPVIGHGGYRRYAIDQRSGRFVNASVHRTVCEAFHGPAPFDDAVVRHLDGDRLNNAADNLAWGSHFENAADTVRMGRQVRGERTHLAKLSDSDVLDIRRRRRQGESAASLARRFGVCESNVRGIVRGRTWTHLPVDIRRFA